MRTLKNQELTKLIGRRLKESLGSGAGSRLPDEICDGLEALRCAERHASRGLVVDVAGNEGEDAAAVDAQDDGSRDRNS